MVGLPKRGRALGVSLVLLLLRSAAAAIAAERAESLHEDKVLLASPSPPLRLSIANRKLQAASITKVGLYMIGSNEEVDISNGIVSLDKLPTSDLYVEAVVVNGGGIKAVKFDHNEEANYRTETKAPYAFCGDSRGDFFTCSDLVEGQHTITATAYMKDGSPIATKTVTFSCK